MNIKKSSKDEKGSEALEMLVTCSVVAFIAYTLIMILIWVYGYYGTASICQKLARQVEITGVYDEVTMSTMAEELSGVDDDTAYNYVHVTAYYLDSSGAVAGEIPSGAKLQLTTPFVIVVHTYDRIPLFGSGSSDVTWHDVPIACRVNGISEMYFKGVT